MALLAAFEANMAKGAAARADEAATRGRVLADVETAKLVLEKRGGGGGGLGDADGFDDFGGSRGLGGARSKRNRDGPRGGSFPGGGKALGRI